ncbi:hypothetical protein D6D04_00897 [Aureobasidium pullulans]|nr:hypothetical protein D6D04_00897 [Aureobasidium pullulans]
MTHMLALVVACLSLAWVSVFVRFWVKIFVTSCVRWDDWILLLAVILFSGQCGCVLVMTTIDPQQPHTTANIVSYMFLASYDLSIMTAICIKTSLAISFNRFFSRRWQRLLIIAITIAFNTYAITELLLGLFFCGMPGKMARKDSLQQCTHWSNMLLWWLVAAIFNAVTDWIYTLLPATVVWTSNLSRKVKASVSIITAVGALSSTAAIFRVLGTGSFTALRDFNPTNLTVIACVVLEMGLGIIATSMMCSTPLPGMLVRAKKISTGATTTTGAYLEEGDTNVIKLSPIICAQKFADDNTWSSTQTTKDGAAADTETLALPTPTGKVNRFSWSRTFGMPESSVPLPARLTLLIDDISDGEDDCEVDKDAREVRQTYSNI